MKHEPTLPPNTLAREALEFVLRKYRFSTVLDVGSGAGAHAAFMRAFDKKVTTISLSDDYGSSPDTLGDFLSADFGETFELLWCSHVLEHQRNVGLFLDKAFRLLRPGGILAVTVPPRKDEIVGGHLSIWNAGLLLYNLVLAGFDCRHAAVLSAGYNVSVVVRKRLAPLPSLRMDEGDIERLARFFPGEVRQGFDGCISELNWDSSADDRPAAGPVLDPTESAVDSLSGRRVGEADDAEHLRWCCRVASIAGEVIELGATPESCAALVASEFEGTKVVRSTDAESAPRADCPIALLHFGSGLDDTIGSLLEKYDSAIVSDTVLVFDEFCEWRPDAARPRDRRAARALADWMHACGRKVRPLASGPLRAGSFVVAS
jgi:SAM-dependent methyltransferase